MNIFCSENQQKRAGFNDSPPPANCSRKTFKEVGEALRNFGKSATPEWSSLKLKKLKDALPWLATPTAERIIELFTALINQLLTRRIFKRFTHTFAVVEYLLWKKLTVVRHSLPSENHYHVYVENLFAKYSHSDRNLLFLSQVSVSGQSVCECIVHFIETIPKPRNKMVKVSSFWKLTSKKLSFMWADEVYWKS